MIVIKIGSCPLASVGALPMVGADGFQSQSRSLTPVLTRYLHLAVPWLRRLALALAANPGHSRPALIQSDSAGRGAADCESGESRAGSAKVALAALPEAGPGGPSKRRH